MYISKTYCVLSISKKKKKHVFTFRCRIHLPRAWLIAKNREQKKNEKLLKFYNSKIE